MEEVHLLNTTEDTEDGLERQLFPPEDGTAGNNIFAIERWSNVAKNVWNTVLERRGTVYGVITGCLIGFQMVAVKGITSQPPYQVMLYRSFPFLLTLPFISWRKSESYNLYDLLFYISYGVLNASGILLMYVALEFAQLGNVSAICTNLPIPSAILSFLLLREPIKIFDIILFVVNFIGLILVTRPPFLFHGDDATESNTEFLGAVIALGSLLSLAMSTICSRKLTYRGNSDSALLTFIAGVTGVVIPGTILFVTQMWDFPSTPMEGFLTLTVALLSLFGNFFVVLGLNYESVITITVLFTLGVPVSFLVGIFVFKEIPDVLSVVGALSILVSTFGCLWKQSFDRR